MHRSFPDRLKAGLGTFLIEGLLGYALLAGLNGRITVQPEQAMKLFDIQPPPPSPKRPLESPRTTPRSGAASPRNLRAIPSDLVVPPPLIRPIVPPPIMAAPIAGPGSSASAGASDRPGPGTGSGGQGIGTGSGSGGNGEGNGGDGTPPRRIGGRIKNSDFPHALSDAGIGGTVAVRYRVGIDGRVSDCLVTGSSGNAELDATTCRLIEQRFRFKPARDAEGRDVASTIVEHHTWVIEADTTPPPAENPHGR